MTPYLKEYCRFFGYDESDFIPCEICGKPAVDIHHIEARGMGGTKKEYSYKEVMALDRACHEKYGDKKQFKDMLISVHEARIAERLMMLN